MDKLVEMLRGVTGPSPSAAESTSGEPEELRNARERSRGETRRRLMAAWLELVAKTPPTRVSIRDVVTKAEVSVGAFYCHFKDKEALNGEVVLECYATLVRELDKHSGDLAPDFESRYVAVLNVLMDFVEHHPAEATFLWRTAPPETQAGDEFLSLWEEFWEQRIEGLFDTLMGGLTIDPSLDRAVLGRAFWGMGERVLSWWLRERDRVPREVVIHTLTRFGGKGVV